MLSKSSPSLGFRHTLLRCISPTKHNVSLPSTSIRPNLFQHKFQDPRGFLHDLHHVKPNNMATNLRSNNRANNQKVHPKRRRDHTSTKNGNWNVHLYTMHASIWCCRMEKKNHGYYKS